MTWLLGLSLAVAAECHRPVDVEVAEAAAIAVADLPEGGTAVVISGPRPCHLPLPETTAEAMLLLDALALRPGAVRHRASPPSPRPQGRSAWLSAHQTSARGERREGVVLGASAVWLTDRWRGPEACVTTSTISLWSLRPEGWTSRLEGRLVFPRLLVCIAPYEPAVSMTCTVPWDDTVFFDECSPIRCEGDDVAISMSPRLVCVRARDCSPAP